MSYYNGSANDMAALRQALISACEAEGWSWELSSNVLRKGSAFVRLQVTGGYLTLLGRTSVTGGDAPQAVRIGALGGNAFTWPIQYHIHLFADEVFLVVRYNVEYFQWAAFGQSIVPGLPGTGMWLGASGGPIASSTEHLNITAAGGGTTGGSNTTSGALFWADVASTASGINSFVHHDLDGRGWDLSDPGSSSYMVGVTDSIPLIALQPNTWNSESVLLPIRAFAIRPVSKLSLVAELQNARYLRIDNHEPGQIITIGEDRWTVYPFYRKSAVGRNGGNSVDHSGTFGWAIRYEVP